MIKVILLWAAIAAPAFAQGVGSIQQPSTLRLFSNPLVIPCTVGVSLPAVYNNAGTDQQYTCGPSGLYIEAPGGSTSTLAASGVGASGAAGANKLVGPASSFITTDSSGNGTGITPSAAAAILPLSGDASGSASANKVTNLSSAAVYLNNNTVIAFNQTGSDAGAKIAAAITALPSSGGAIDAQGISGGAINSAIFSGVTKPITLILGAGSWVSNTTQMIPANVTIQFAQGAGGTLSPASGTTLTIAGGINAPDGQQIFPSSYSGTLTLSTPAKISIGWFGPDPTHATDSTVRIQNALNSVARQGKCLQWPSGYYKVTTLSVPNFTCWEGGGPQFEGADGANSTFIGGTTGMDTLQPSIGSDPYAIQLLIRNMGISGGLNGLHVPSSYGITNLVMENASIAGSNDGILIESSIERSRFQKVQFGATTGHGFAITNDGDPTTNYIDKTDFLDCRWLGGISGFFHDTARVSNEVHFQNPIFNFQISMGMQILGPTQDFTIDISNNENIGDPATTPATQGVVTTGTTSGANATNIVVASATTLAAGQVITIQAADIDGGDLATCVASSYAGGTTIPTDSTSCTAPNGQVTIKSPIPVQVTNAEVTNNTGYLIFLGPPSQSFPSDNNGTSNNLTINGTTFTDTTGANILYSMDISRCNNCHLNDVRAGDRPIYDRNAQAVMTNAAGVRTGNTAYLPYPFYFQNLRTRDYSISPATFPVTFPSDNGGDIYMPLVGTTGNGQTGNFGSFVVMTTGPNRRNYFTVNGQTGLVQIGPFDDGSAVPNLLIGGATPGSGINTLILTDGTCNSVGTVQSSLCSVSAVLTTPQPFKAASLTGASLTSGNCVQASTGGLLTTTSTPCGIGSSYAGTGTSTFAPQAGAGTGATAVCATSHVCDSFSGEVTLTSGSVGTPATGSQLIITLPVTRANLPNCSVDLYGGSTFLGASKTVTTSTITISSGVALTFATAYTVDYVCGGN